MPYKKRSNYQRKKPYKRRVNKTKKLLTGQSPTMLENIASGVGSVAKLAQAVMPAIMAINTESKFYDQTASVTAYNPGTNDQLIALTQNIAQGTDESQRIGNSILAKDLQLRLALSFPATTGSPNVMAIHARIMLIAWKDNAQGNAPSVANIFQAPTNLYSPINRDQSDQLVVIKDKFITLESSAGITATAGLKALKMFKKLDWHIRYNATTANSGTANHVYLILRSSSSGSANALGCTYYSRLNFTDN